MSGECHGPAAVLFMPFVVVWSVIISRVAERHGMEVIRWAMLACAVLMVVDYARRVWRGRTT